MARVLFTLRLFGIRGYRLGILLLIGWLLHEQMTRLRQRPAAEIPLESVRAIFPTAAKWNDPVVENGWRVVLNKSGNKVGEILTTAPVTDHILGYAGPSNVLIGRDSTGALMGVRLLSSGDTPKHLALVEKSSSFWDKWKNWNTSNAIAESIILRVSGNSISLRFPQPVTLDEAKRHFPNAASVISSETKLGVKDQQGQLLGYLMRTSPTSDNISGYSGPTECLVSLAPDGITVQLVTLRKTYDTESYVETVAQDPHYLNIFKGRTLQTLAGLDYEKERIEGVSGSTKTSYAIAESLRQRASTVLTARPEDKSWLRWQLVDWVLLAMISLALLLSLSRLRGNTTIRVIWQLTVVLVLGIWVAQLVSLSLLAGWAQHGFPWRTAPGVCLLVALALLFPWISRRQIYCHHLCPHGAAQSLLGLVIRRKWTLPPRWHRLLRLVPGLTLVTALLAFAIAVRQGGALDLTLLEPFDAWGWRAVAWIPISIAGVGLIASLFVPLAYCHYGCPTGALLKYIRSPGGNDRFGLTDWLAGIVVLAVFAVTLVHK
jgi:NosR/NirI family nitrous oxide reductase transcriptional regulator